ncbi:MAG: high-affinity nickel-transport family protein [Deltaproteobacteria bacterium]|nr:high-affinity nickel-transport family protein [Deltaproteobacteria bacterium]
MSFGSAPFGLILLGLTLGMRHATDPDHVIAVTAILTRERRFFSAARVGLVWGLGHSATVLAVGMAIVFFKLKVPARLGLSLEFMVAIVLILLGLRAAKETLALIANKLRAASSPEAMLMVHSHPHTHERRGRTHTHRHLHAHSSLDDIGFAAHDHLMPPALAKTISGRSVTKSFMVGLVHGLAGSAAIALLVTAAIPSPLWAMLYIAIFCCGVMLGMILITAAIGAPFVLAAQRLAGVHRRLSMAAGWLSFGFGIFLAYQIGITDQLFGSAPHWLPH